jgi:hypothetical protein
VTSHSDNVESSLWSSFKDSSSEQDTTRVCKKQCVYDGRLGVCKGCGRTLEEIERAGIQGRKPPPRRG